MYLFSNPLTNVSRYSMCEAHNRRGWCWGMLEVWQGACWRCGRGHAGGVAGGVLEVWQGAVAGVAGVQWGVWYHKVSGGNAATVCG